MSSDRQVARSDRVATEGEDLRQRGEFSAAYTYFTKAIKRAGTAAARGDSAGVRAVTTALVGRGRVLLARGEPAGALEEFEQARRLAPDHWEPRYWSGCALASAGDLHAAENALSGAIAVAPGVVSPYVQRGFVRVESAQLGGALEDLIVAEQLGGLDERGRLVQVQLLLLHRQWAAADAALNRLRSYSAAPQLALLHGYCLEGQGRWMQACAAYDHARSSPQLSATACSRLGLANLKAGDLKAAQGWLEQACREGADDDMVLYHRGWVAYQTSEFDTAVSCWSRLRRRHPHRQRLDLLVGRAHLAWAADLARRHRDEEAIGHLEEYWSLRPDDPEVIRALAELHYRAGAGLHRSGEDLGGLRDHLEAGCRLAPDDFRFPYFLALVSHIDGDTEVALKLVEDASAKAPGQHAVRLALALATIESGDLGHGERALDQVMGSSDAVAAAPARRAKAALLVRQEAWSAAADAFLSLAATDRWRLRGAAECLFRAGRLGELLSLKPSDDELRAWKGRALAARGRMTEALDILEHHRDRGIPQPAGRQTLTVLRRLLALEQATTGAWDDAAATLALAGPDELAGHDPTLDALVMILGDQRRVALQTLQGALRMDPDDYALAHVLALSLLHSVRAGLTVSGVETDQAVTLCIGAWVAVLSSTAFWESLRTGSEHRYESTVSGSAVGEVQAVAGTTLVDMLEPTTDELEVAVLFHRESKAAACLSALGGLPLPGGGGRNVVCGPLLLDPLGLTAALGAYVAGREGRDPAGDVGTMLKRLLLQLLEDDADDLPDLGELAPPADGLRRQFSQLGLIEARFQLGHPAVALAELDHLACASCRRRRSESDEATESELRVCEASCPRFDVLNPGFAGLPDKAERLMEDAALLGVEIRLGLAKAAITAGNMDLDEAVVDWQAAIGLAAQIGRSNDVQASAMETVFGRVESLRGVGRLDDAVDLLGAARRVCHGDVAGQLDGRLAETLTDRGVKAGNHQQWDEAVSDLRRATALNPYAPRPLANLAIALQAAASRDWEAGSRESAVDLLEEVLGSLAGGLSRIPGHPDLTKQWDNVEEEFRQATNSHAVDLANGGQFEGALTMFRRGLNRFPSDELLTTNRRAVTLAFVFDLLGRGETAYARRVVDQAMQAAAPGERALLARLLTGGR